MRNEINSEILKFRTRWKYHNLSIILGFVFFLVWIATIILTFHTVMFYDGGNKVYCVIIEFVMWFLAKKLYTDTIPDKQTRQLYISEYYQLDAKIEHIMKTEIDNAFTQFMQNVKEKKGNEK